jgi:hypothetical protein
MQYISLLPDHRVRIVKNIILFRTLANTLLFVNALRILFCREFKSQYYITHGVNSTCKVVGEKKKAHTYN